MLYIKDIEKTKGTLKMTKEQAQRLDAAIAKNNLYWWEVLEKIGFENYSNHEVVEAAIEVLEKMGNTKL